MRVYRKLGFGAMALALFTLSATLLTTSASAKKSPPNPIICTQLSGTVTFAAPGLSLNGAHTTAKTAVTTVTGITLTCPGSGPTSGPGPQSVKVKNVKDPKVKGQKPTYTYDTFTIFAGSTPAIAKSIKKMQFTINGQSVLFKNKVVNVLGPADCGGELGFSLTGQVTKGLYNVGTGNEAEIQICLGKDSGSNTTNSFIADLTDSTGTVVIASAQIDPDESEATL